MPGLSANDVVDAPLVRREGGRRLLDWIRGLLRRGGAKPASVEHFLWAATEVGWVTLSTGGVELLARLEIPNDLGTLRVQIDPRSLMEAPIDPVGQEVVMRYSGEEASYRCETRVFMVEDPDLWWLTFPQVVETDNRRLLERLTLDPTRGGAFRLQLRREAVRLVAALCNISVTGVSFYYCAERLRLHRGAHLRATLQLSEDEIMEVELEVVWLAPERSEDLRLAGARFLALSWGDRQALQEAISYYRRLPQLILATDEQDL